MKQKMFHVKHYEENKRGDKSMTERERLADLLYEWGNEENEGVRAESIAKYLLEHGVIVLPCKIGDTAYCILDEHPETEEKGQFVTECGNPILGIFVTADDTYICTEKFEKRDNITPELDRIGTRYSYLTKKEAQQALTEKF